MTDIEDKLSLLYPIEDCVIRMRKGLPYKPRTLDFIGSAFRMTRERVRQIEEIAFKKIRRIDKKRGGILKSYLNLSMK